MSQQIIVTTNLDIDPWTDLYRAGTRVAPVDRVGVLPNATEGGKAAVEIGIRMPDGTVVVGEMTLALFRSVAAAVLACPVAQMEDM